MRWLVLTAALLGCTSIDSSRDSASAQVREEELSTHLDIKVQGGSILSTIPATDEGPAWVTVRAQSLDMRIDVQSNGCAPETVIIEATHLPAEVVTTWRPMLDGVFPEAAAAREAAGGLVDFIADPEDRDRTPLAAETAFETEVLGDGLLWTVHIDRSRGVAWIEPGIGDFVPAGSGACATLDATGSTALGQAPLVARLRLRRTVDGPYTFAVWGNNSGNAGVRQRITQAVNESGALFAIVNGDLTSGGSLSQLDGAVEQLDALLDIPWFATPGDKEIASELDQQVILAFGASTFALDVGALRIMVADSADAAFTDSTHNAIGRWLTDTALWWPATPAPPQRLLITHVPPFDPYGARNLGFKSRQDAARVISVLRRGDVPQMITSQFATFDRRVVGDVEIVHSGGGGAAIESSSSATHHWLEVSVGADCSPPDGRGADDGETCVPADCEEIDGRTICPCAGGLWCTEQTCRPCVTITERPI